MLGQFTRVVTLVQRVLADTPDAFGNDRYTDTPRTVRAVYAPGTTQETENNRDSLLDQPSIFLDPGEDLSYLDAVIIDGDTFEVDGTPRHWVHPITGWAPGVEVKLKRAAG